jgi:argininosuccinate lyase
LPDIHTCQQVDEMTDDATREHILSYIGTSPDRVDRTSAARAVDSGMPGHDFGTHFGMVLKAHVVELRRGEVIDDITFTTLARSLRDATPGSGATASRSFMGDLEERIDSLLPDSLKGAATLGLSREEWIATAGRLVWRDASLAVHDRLLAVSVAAQALAETHVVTVMPAYLAGRPAQPTTLGHFLGALLGPLASARRRTQEGFPRLNRSPLGSGLLAGDVLAADREDLAHRLGFGAPIANTLDALASVEDVIEFLDATSAALAPLLRFLREIVTWIRTDPTSFVIDDDWIEAPEPAQPSLVMATRVERLQANTRACLDSLDGLRGQLRELEYGPLGAAWDSLLERAPALVEDVGAVLAEMCAFLEQGLIVNRAYLGNRAGRGHSTAGDLAVFLMTEEGVSPVAARRIAALVLSRLRDSSLEVGGITQDMIDSAALMTIGQEIKVEMEALGRYLAPRRYLERRQVTGSPAPAMTRDWLAAERDSLDRDRDWLDGAISSTRAAIEALDATVAEAAADVLES